MDLQEKGIISGLAKSAANLVKSGVNSVSAKVNQTATNLSTNASNLNQQAQSAQSSDLGNIMNSTQMKAFQGAVKKLQTTANQYMAKAKPSQQKLFNQFVTPMWALVQAINKDPVNNFPKVTELEKLITQLDTETAKVNDEEMLERVTEAAILGHLLNEANPISGAIDKVKQGIQKNQASKQAGRQAAAVEGLNTDDAKQQKQDVKDAAVSDKAQAKQQTKIAKTLASATNAQAKTNQTVGKQQDKQANLNTQSAVKNALSTGHYVQALKPFVDELKTTIEPLKAVIQQFAASNGTELASNGPEFNLKTKDGLASFQQEVAKDPDLTKAIQAINNPAVKDLKTFMKFMLQSVNQIQVQESVDNIVQALREAANAQSKGVLSGLVQKVEANPNDLATLNAIRNNINGFQEELPAYGEYRDVIDAYIALLKRTMTEAEAQKLMNSSGGEHEERGDEGAALTGDLAKDMAAVIRADSGGVIKKAEFNQALVALKNLGIQFQN